MWASLFLSNKIMATPADPYSPSLDRVLEAYRYCEAQYKMTGDPYWKRQSDNAKTWMTNYLRWMEGRVTTNSDYINRFVSEYSKTNPELSAMQTSLKTIKTQGPQLENTYRTDKEAAETTPRDFTPYYVKGGVILGVAALVAVLAL